MPLPKIVRKAGPYKRKYGIHLEHLKPYQAKILYNNPLSAKHFMTDDQFTLILFKIADLEIINRNENKVYYNPYRDIISDEYEEIIEDSKKINWHCAICKEDIKSIISEFNVGNLICDTCFETHGKTKIIDSRIVAASIEFRKHCKDLLIKEQKGYLKYVRKFERGY